MKGASILLLASRHARRHGQSLCQAPKRGASDTYAGQLRRHELQHRQISNQSSSQFEQHLEKLSVSDQPPSRPKLKPFTSSVASTRAAPTVSARRVPTADPKTLPDEDVAAEGTLGDPIKALRSLMQRQPQSVVICTSSIIADENGRAHPCKHRGMTVSSFTTLSMNPKPLITFNIKLPSRTYSAIESSRKLKIHMLLPDLPGVKIAKWFTRGAGDGSSADRLFTELKKQTDCTAFAAAPGEAPRLKGHAIYAILDCAVVSEPSNGLIPVQDHAIVVAEVLGATSRQHRRVLDRFGQQTPMAQGSELSGPVYVWGKYRPLGKYNLPSRRESDINQQEVEEWNNWTEDRDEVGGEKKGKKMPKTVKSPRGPRKN